MLFEQILTLIPCAVFWKDTEGVFQGCNQVFLEFSGMLDKNNLIGKTDKELSWADRWQEYYRDDQHVIVSGNTLTKIERVSLPEKEITAHTTKAPWLQYGKIAGVIGVINDISELVEARELIKAREQAEIANQLKAEFVQNMQHDIRTPTSGLWSVLSSLVTEETDEEKKEKLVLLRDSAKQLYDICNDVIDFDRVERGEIPLTARKFSIQNVVSNVIDLNRAIAYKKKLDLSFSIDSTIPLVVKGDKYRVSRILVNLVGNAIKFTNVGYIKIIAKLLKYQNKEVIIQFEVQDSGIGISQEKRNFLYEKFSRGTPSNRNAYHGSGLGLQIVKQFVADLNGEIEVQSDIGKGSVFYITIPLETPLVDQIYDNEESEDFTPEQISLEEVIQNKITYNAPDKFNANPKQNVSEVLLIEDDRLAQMVSLNLIKSMGCEVELVDSVKNSLVALNARRFHLVVSDIGLPDGTGFDIIRTVREDINGLNYTTPFIALTAHTDKAKKLEMEKSGFVKILAKPLMIEQIKTILNTYINKVNQEKDDIKSGSKIIDLALSKQRALDNEQMMWQLLEILSHQLPDYITTIEAARKSNDIRKLRENFHKLKGALSYCGVQRLQNATDALHDAVKDNENLPDIDHLFTEFYIEIECFLQEYKQLKGK